MLFLEGRSAAAPVPVAATTIFGMGTGKLGAFTAGTAIMGPGGRMLVRIRAAVQSILRVGDVFLLAVSPLAILMFVVGLIVLADRAGEHNRFVRDLRAGSVVNAEVTEVDQEEDLITVRYLAGGEERYGLLYTHYYPGAFEDLRAGQSVRVRILPQAYEARVAWEERFAQVEGYLGYAVEPGIILAIAWLVVVLHPEFLYLGYAEALPSRKAMARP
jgi:hypothetical protein